MAYRFKIRKSLAGNRNVVGHGVKRCCIAVQADVSVRLGLTMWSVASEGPQHTLAASN